MSKYRYNPKLDKRDYVTEARELVNSLKGNQLYDMYEIVTKKLKQSNSDVRDRELMSVKKTIEADPRAELHRLKFIINGYKSEMAQTGVPRDGYSKPARKKA